MTTYLDEIAAEIRAEVADQDLPSGDTEDLFRLYAVLCITTGVSTTAANVHDAWVVWMQRRDAEHPSLVPFAELEAGKGKADEPFADAIRKVASRTDIVTSSLIPGGPPRDQTSMAQFYEQYRLMVASSEALVARRQQVNTFFLTITGAILTAAALFLRGGAAHTRFQASAIAVLSGAGLALSIAWRSLIRSFGQLNTGKFAVINRMEKHLAASVYAAEWKALGEGKDPKVYRSFTSREVWAPNVLIGVYALATLVATLIAGGVIDL